MELALNLIWLLMSAATFAAFVRRARDRRLAATAAICLAAIAFPIISITDDLCNEVLFADASTIRRTVHCAQLRPFAVAADVIGFQLVLVEVRCCGIVAVRSPITPAARSLAVVAERGPPLRAL